MTKFIPISSVENARLLSARFWQLVMPLSQRQPDAVAQYLFPWYVHPVSGAVVMEMPETYDIPVHLDADAEPIREILAPFVVAGHVTQQEVDDSISGLYAKAGQRAIVFDLLPAFWQNLAKTKEQLTELGWFPQISF